MSNTLSTVPPGDSGNTGKPVGAPAQPASLVAKRAAKNEALAVVSDDIIYEVTMSYLDEIDPKITNQPLPPVTMMKRELLTRTNTRFDIINAGATGPNRLVHLKTLTPPQVARIMARLHRVIMITPSVKNTDADLNILAIYCEEGPQAGLYVSDDRTLRSVARLYNRELLKAGGDEVMHILREVAPQVQRCLDPNLVPLRNGIFNYTTKELMAWDPELVFMSKSGTDWNENASNVVLVGEDPVLDSDGKKILDANGKPQTVPYYWDVESWMRTLSDDEEIVELLWEILGALVRPFVRWNKTAFFYSEEGNNGKGTFAELGRRLVGSACVSIPINDFSSDFLLEPLLRANAVITDENDVGTFIDKVANFKAAVTNDVITINRKHKPAINYQFWGFVIQCLNGFPQSRDKSQSFYRRQLFVPFEKNFTGIERTYIKGDFLARTEVLEYVLKRVLMDMPNYYALSEPEATRKVHEEYKEANDPVRAFWFEHEHEFVWDLLPFTFLYDLYRVWYSENYPSGKSVGRNGFIRDLSGVIKSSTIWFCSDRNKAVRTGSRMSVAEPLILRYDLIKWKTPGYTGKEPRLAAIPATATSYRGLERYAHFNAR